MIFFAVKVLIVECLCIQTGQTALMVAVKEGNLDAARILVASGADVDITDEVSILKCGLLGWGKVGN